MDWLDEAYALAGMENNQTIRQDQVMEVMEEAIQLVKLFAIHISIACYRCLSPHELEFLVSVLIENCLIYEHIYL